MEERHLTCAHCGRDRPDDDERCPHCDRERYHHGFRDPEEFWEHQRLLDEHGR